MKSRWIYLLSLLFCYNVNVMAKPIVIYNSGQTTPMEISLPSARQKLQRAHEKPAPASMNIRRVPVVTTTMKPGKVKRRAVKLPYLNSPIFIVGYDKLSIAWLQKHNRRLKKLGAVGIAVNVQTEQQVSFLEKAAGGVSIAPIPGTKVGKELALKHYPAIVSSALIEQ